MIDVCTIIRQFRGYIHLYSKSKYCGKKIFCNIYITYHILVTEVRHFCGVICTLRMIHFFKFPLSYSYPSGRFGRIRIWIQKNHQIRILVGIFRKIRQCIWHAIPIKINFLSRIRICSFKSLLDLKRKNIYQNKMFCKIFLSELGF